MGRRHTGSKVYDRTADEVWAVIADVAAKSAFKETDSDPASMTFRAKKSLKDVDIVHWTDGGLPGSPRRAAQKTWGEKLEVVIRADGKRTKVDVESKLKFGLIDWGANKDNVERFFRALDSELS